MSLTETAAGFGVSKTLVSDDIEIISEALKNDEESLYENRSRGTGRAAVEAEEKISRLNALRGSGKDLKMTVEGFIAMTHDETNV
jgi:hypothetical protein